MDTQYKTGLASLFTAMARPDAPEFVLALLKSSSDGKTAEVIAVYFGQKGYRSTTYGRHTQEWVDEMNARLDIDQATAMAFEACSLFGRWQSYEEIKREMAKAVINV